MLTLIITNFLTHGFPHVAPDTLALIITICVVSDLQLIARSIFH